MHHYNSASFLHFPPSHPWSSTKPEMAHCAETPNTEVAACALPKCPFNIISIISASSGNWQLPPGDSYNAGTIYNDPSSALWRILSGDIATRPLSQPVSVPHPFPVPWLRSPNDHHNRDRFGDRVRTPHALVSPSKVALSSGIHFWHAFGSEHFLWETGGKHSSGCSLEATRWPRFLVSRFAAPSLGSDAPTHMESTPLAGSHLLARFVLQIFWERVHINQLVKCNSFGMGCWSGFGGSMGWDGLGCLVMVCSILWCMQHAQRS